jgi:LPXTG-motif cell wall-anchored protein
MRRVLGTIALAGCAVLATAPAASAQSKPCDTYSGTCVKGVKQVKPPTRTRVSPTRLDLPFTGGQVTGLLAAGGLSIAAGTVLVTAGRKRRSSAPAV